MPSHSSSVRAPKVAASYGGDRRLIVVVLPIGEVACGEELAQSPEEPRLERADGEMATVGRRIDAVTRERAGGAAWAPARRRDGANEIRERCVIETTMQRRGRCGSGPGAREHPRDGSERAGGEVGDLEGRQLWERVHEDARPAEVVDIVAGT